MTTLRVPFRIPTRHLEEHIVKTLLNQVKEASVEYPRELLDPRRTEFLAHLDETTRKVRPIAVERTGS